MVKPLIKKLDLLVIKAFIGPFIATFFITLFVLVLQFMWLYIDDVVGKGVDLITVSKLLLYVAATVVPLALPLAVLLSSIMTFGNLGETYELVAIKSAGISVLRFMRPLFIVSLFICYIAFLFNNNIMPLANLKMNTLKYDIIMSKPAFNIKEGVFYDKIEGYVIKIGKKEKDDSTIRNVVIYEQDYSGLQDDIIVAEKGKMIVTPDHRALEFILQNGALYREKGDRASTNTEFVRMGFSEYKKVLDLSSFKLNMTNDSAFRNNYQMLTMRELTRNIDSLDRLNDSYRQRAATSIQVSLKFSRYLDTTGWKNIEKIPTITSVFLLPPAKADSERRRRDYILDSIDRSSRPVVAAHPPASATPAPTHPAGNNPPGSTAAAKDTAAVKGPANAAVVAKSSPDSTAAAAAKTQPGTTPAPVLTLYDYLPDSARNAVLDRSIAELNGLKANIDQPSYLYESEENDLTLHRIAWHEKLTLSVACLVMFLIGAPLGSIIRKGGIGLPLVFAVVFFVIFFLLNNFGKKFVKQDVLTPIAGMWLATYILTPIGIFLTYKAIHDSQLFNKEFYFRTIKKVRTLLQRRKASGETEEIL